MARIGVFERSVSCERSCKHSRLRVHASAPWRVPPMPSQNRSAVQHVVLCASGVRADLGLDGTGARGRQTSLRARIRILAFRVLDPRRRRQTLVQEVAGPERTWSCLSGALEWLRSACLREDRDREPARAPRLRCPSAASTRRSNEAVG